MFWNNLERRINSVVIQLNHADSKGISNIAKSSYYRAATILMCTIIEGLVYQLVKKHAGNHPYVIGDCREYTELQKLNKSNIGTSKNIFVCEKNKINICIDDSNVGFGKLNIFLKNHRIINTSEYGKLNKIRIERNKIHLQGLNTTDTGYTKRNFNLIADALPVLLRKLK